MRVLPEHCACIPAVLNTNVQAPTQHRRAHETIGGITLDGRLSNDKFFKWYARGLVDLKKAGLWEIVARIPDEPIAGGVAIVSLIVCLRIGKEEQEVVYLVSQVE